MAALKRGETGVAVQDLARELGASRAMLYRWRAKFGGLDTSMLSRMRELEERNRRFKKMYLEENLKAEIVSDAIAKKW